MGLIDSNPAADLPHRNEPGAPKLPPARKTTSIDLHHILQEFEGAAIAYYPEAELICRSSMPFDWRKGLRGVLSGLKLTKEDALIFQIADPDVGKVTITFLPGDYYDCISLTTVPHNFALYHISTLPVD